MPLPTLSRFLKLTMAVEASKSWCDFYDDFYDDDCKWETASKKNQWHSEIKNSNSLGHDGQSYRHNSDVPSSNGQSSSFIQKGNIVPSAKASPMKSSSTSFGISKVSASLVNNEPKHLLQQKVFIDVKKITESVKHQAKDNSEDLADDVPLCARSNMNSDHGDNAVLVLSSGETDDDDTNPLSPKLFRKYNWGTCSSNYDHSVHKKPISEVQKVSQNGSGATNKQEKPSTLLGKRPPDKSNFLNSSVKKSMVSKSDPAASINTKLVLGESDDDLPVSQRMKKLATLYKRQAKVNNCGSASYKRQAKKSKRSTEGLEYSILSAELDFKVKELAWVKKSIEKCQMKRLDEQQRLHTIERDIDKCFKELETKKKQVASIQGQLSSMKKQCEGRVMELDSKEKQFEGRLKDLKLKENQLEGRVKELESIEEHLEGWEKELRSKGKQFEGRVKDLESKDKQFEGRVKDIESKENNFEERAKELESKEKQFEGRVKELKSKDNKFEEQVKEFESKERQFEDRVKELESKEKQFEGRVKELESKDNKFQVQVKELNSKKNQFERQVKELWFKEKQFEVQVRELEFKEKQFEGQAKDLESKQNQLEGQLKELELKENHYEAQKVPDKQLSLTTDGRSLQLHSNVQTHETESISDNDVLVNLKTSPDPAKLVLDIIQNPIFPQCRKEGNAVIIDRYQIFLLEQLMRLSPHIEPHVRDEAMKLALDLEANIRASTENSVVVLGFLLLLSIYGLVSYFNEDEVLKLFEFVTEDKQAVEMFWTLGFVDKVSDFIQRLIEKQQHIEAVGFICAYKLVEKYQPVDLLREYVQNARLIYESSLKKAKSIEIKVKAIDQEFASLESVQQCISDNNIESQDLHKEIQDRILELQRQFRSQFINQRLKFDV